MSILKKIIYPICMASLLCACPITASAVEVSDTEIGSITATLNATTETDTTAAEESSTSTTSAKFSIANASGNVGDNVEITITADADTAFASATFVLHYDSSKLKYVDYSIPSNSGLNNENLTRVEDKDSGVVYLVLAETEEDIKNANITMTFEILNVGNTQVFLEISDMFTTDGTEVPIPDVQATGTITGVEKETEPPVTTTTESSDIETTTTTVSNNNDSTETTTTASTEAEKTESSTTSLTEAETTESSTTSSDSTTTPASTEQSSDTTTSTQQPANSTATTSKRTTSANSTTTAKSTTTSSQDSNEIPKTGDNFPTLPLAVALGISASIAVATKKHNKS